jgi:hypothetical protein
MTHEEYLDRQWKRAVTLAKGILDGKLGVIEGSHALAAIGVELTDNVHESPFSKFAVVESDTDRFPISDARRHWDPEALRSKDEEIASYETRARSDVEAACREVLMEAARRDATS